MKFLDTFVDGLTALGRSPDSGASSIAAYRLIVRIERFVNSVFAALQQARCERRAIAELQALTDYQLRDIGLDRQSLEIVVKRRGRPVDVETTDSPPVLETARIEKLVPPQTVVANNGDADTAA